MPDALVEQIYATTEAERVYNLYGPTEDTTYSTFTLVRRGSAGDHRQADCEFTSLHPRRPVGSGADRRTGRVVSRRRGLARGYYGQPELTRERFVV